MNVGLSAEYLTKTETIKRCRENIAWAEGKLTEFRDLPFTLKATQTYLETQRQRLARLMESRRD